MALFRSRLYDRGVLEIVDTKTPIISIGNLTTGGTGKTPITSYLTSALTERGYDVSIVSRGYGASETGPVEVPKSFSEDGARRFGDEPSWLASQHPDSSVVIGVRRPEAVQFLNQKRAAFSIGHLKRKHVVVADDAFQHRRLKRELDVVVIDASAPEWQYRPLPLGRMREEFSALSRAQFVFLSKTNLATEDQLRWIRAKTHQFSGEMNFKTVEFGVELAGVVPLEKNASDHDPLRLGAARVLLLSGIAQPETFERLLKEREGVSVIKHLAFDDHRTFTKDDLERAERQAIELSAQAIVVTEKDAVKLTGWRPTLPCYVSRLKAKPLTSLEDFYEAVDRLT